MLYNYFELNKFFILYINYLEDIGGFFICKYILIGILVKFILVWKLMKVFDSVENRIFDLSFFELICKDFLIINVLLNEIRLNEVN